MWLPLWRYVYGLGWKTGQKSLDPTQSLLYGLYWHNRHTLLKTIHSVTPFHQNHQIDQNFPQLFSTFLNLIQLLILNLHSLLRSSSLCKMNHWSRAITASVVRVIIIVFSFRCHYQISVSRNTLRYVYSAWSKHSYIIKELFASGCVLQNISALDWFKVLLHSKYVGTISILWDQRWGGELNKHWSKPTLSCTVCNAHHQQKLLKHNISPEYEHRGEYGCKRDQLRLGRGIRRERGRKQAWTTLLYGKTKKQQKTKKK